jgi:quercetin 2,3-dioxygenase
MITLRLAEDRGHADHGWLKSHHSFSFADYHDPAHMGFGNLRVINEDRIAPGTGFGTHGHRDMEIVSYVLEGALAHKDSMGTTSAILPGEVQRMTAGTGVRHSEFNHAPDATTHFLQIWLLPGQRGLPPGYEQKAFADADKRGRLQRVAAPDAAGGEVTLHADAQIWVGLFDGAESAELPLPAGRRTWVHLARGELTVNGQPLKAGDALGLVDEPRLSLGQGRGAEVLVFDLAL